MPDPFPIPQPPWFSIISLPLPNQPPPPEITYALSPFLKRAYARSTTMITHRVTEWIAQNHLLEGLGGEAVQQFLHAQGIPRRHWAQHVAVDGTTPTLILNVIPQDQNNLCLAAVAAHLKFVEHLTAWRCHNTSLNPTIFHQTWTEMMRWRHCTHLLFSQIFSPLCFGRPTNYSHLEITAPPQKKWNSAIDLDALSPMERVLLKAHVRLTALEHTMMDHESAVLTPSYLYLIENGVQKKSDLRPFVQAHIFDRRKLPVFTNDEPLPDKTRRGLEQRMAMTAKAAGKTFFHFTVDGNVPQRTGDIITFGSALMEMFGHQAEMLRALHDMVKSEREAKPASIYILGHYLDPTVYREWFRDITARLGMDDFYDLTQRGFYGRCQTISTRHYQLTLPAVISDDDTGRTIADEFVVLRPENRADERGSALHFVKPDLRAEPLQRLRVIIDPTVVSEGPKSMAPILPRPASFSLSQKEVATLVAQNSVHRVSMMAQHLGELALPSDRKAYVRTVAGMMYERILTFANHPRFASTRNLLALAESDKPADRSRATDIYWIHVIACDEAPQQLFALVPNGEGYELSAERLRKLMEIEDHVRAARRAAGLTFFEATEELPPQRTEKVPQPWRFTAITPDLLPRFRMSFSAFRLRWKFYVEASRGHLSEDETLDLLLLDIYRLNPALLAQDFKANFTNLHRSTPPPGIADIQNALRDWEQTCVAALKRQAIKRQWLVETDGRLEMTPLGMKIAGRATPIHEAQLRYAENPQGHKHFTAKAGLLPLTELVTVRLSAKHPPEGEYVVVDCGGSGYLVARSQIERPVALSETALVIPPFGCGIFQNERRALEGMTHGAMATIDRATVTGGLVISKDIVQRHKILAENLFVVRQHLERILGKDAPLRTLVLGEEQTTPMRVTADNDTILIDGYGALASEPFLPGAALHVRLASDIALALPGEKGSSEEQMREKVISVARYQLGEWNNDPDYLLSILESLEVRRDDALRRTRRDLLIAWQRRRVVDTAQRLIGGEIAAAIAEVENLRGTRSLTAAELLLLHPESHHALKNAIRHAFEGRIGWAASSSNNRTMHHSGLTPDLTGVYAFRVPLGQFQVKDIEVNTTHNSRRENGMVLGVQYNGKVWLFDEDQLKVLPITIVKQVSEVQHLEAQIGVSLAPYIPTAALPDHEVAFRVARLRAVFGDPKNAMGVFLRDYSQDKSEGAVKELKRAIIEAFLEYAYPDWMAPQGDESVTVQLGHNFDFVALRRTNEIERLEQTFMMIVPLIEAAASDASAAVNYIQSVVLPYLRATATRRWREQCRHLNLWAKKVFDDLNSISDATMAVLSAQSGQRMLEMYEDDAHVFCGMDEGAIPEAIGYFNSILSGLPLGPGEAPTICWLKRESAPASATTPIDDLLDKSDDLFHHATEVLSHFSPSVAAQFLNALENRAAFIAGRQDPSQLRHLKMLSQLCRHLRILGSQTQREALMQGIWNIGGAEDRLLQRSHGEVHFVYHLEIAKVQYFVEVCARPERYRDANGMRPRTLRMDVFLAQDVKEFDRLRQDKNNEILSFRLEEPQNYPGRFHFNLQGRVQGFASNPNTHVHFNGEFKEWLNANFSTCCEHFIQHVLWFHP